ncbi:MAG: hypothetical protein AAGC57_16180 [Pseudomonadota bacterium]
MSETLSVMVVVAAGAALWALPASAVTQVSCGMFPFDTDPVAVSCGTPPTPGDPDGVRAWASADITTGELKMFGQMDGSGTLNVQSLSNEEITFSGLGAGAVIQFILDVDAAISGEAAGNSLQMWLGLSQADENSPFAGVEYAYSLLDIDHDNGSNEVSEVFGFTTSGGTISALSMDRSALDYRLEVSATLTDADPTIYVLNGLNMLLGADTGFITGDVSNTASLSIITPDGVTFSSENGLLTAAVPLPASLSLLLVGLGLLAARGGRSRPA